MYSYAENKDKKEHWVVINFQNALSLVTIRRDEEYGYKWYWSGGVTWCSSKTKPEIVHDYGVIPIVDEDTIQGIILHFYQNFNVPKEAEGKAMVGSGWLAPDGKFFACPYSLHDSTARHLGAIYYNSHDGTQELEKRGWIRIYSDGYIGIPSWDTVKATNAQIDTMVAILLQKEEVEKDEESYVPSEYFRHLKDAMEMLVRRQDINP